MTRDWFDPFGIRGSRLDPFVMFTNALKGQGPAGQSAEVISTTIAQRIVGRRVQIDAGMTIRATVDAVDEARPPAPLSAISTALTEVPMWERVRLRLRDIELGEWHVEDASLDATDIRLVGANSQSISVDRVEYRATIRPAEAVRWAAAVEGDHRLRVRDGRIEVTDRRLERWVWLEVDVAAHEQTIVVTPVAVRALSRALPLPGWLRRPVERGAPWLPQPVMVESVAVVDDSVIVRGELSACVVPVDMARVLADLGAESTMTVLRIVTGGW